MVRPVYPGVVKHKPEVNIFSLHRRSWRTILEIITLSLFEADVLQLDVTTFVKISMVRSKTYVFLFSVYFPT